MKSSKQIDQFADFNQTPALGQEADFRRDDSGTTAWLQSILLVGLGLTWGGITAFSMAFEDLETKVQGFGLLLACFIAFFISGPRLLIGWLGSASGLLVAAHVSVAVISGLLAGAQVESIIRYVALLPAFALLLAMARIGSHAVHRVRFGLTFAGIVFVAYHLTEMEYGSLEDPMYRITVFLNTNSTAFIAAMTGISALDFALHPAGRLWKRIPWGAVVLACGLLLFGTKSRTALLAMFAGMAVLASIRFRTPGARIILGALLIALIAYGFRSRDFVAHTFSLDHEDRSIETATGRFEVWRFLIQDEIPKNPWLGIGPGQHNEVVFATTGSSSAHNGILASMAETGALGTIPLLLLLVWIVVQAWRRREDPGARWAASIFAAGFVESVGEVVFFSIGNPASLLFMLAVATLSTPSEEQLSGEVANATDAEPLDDRELTADSAA